MNNKDIANFIGSYPDNLRIVWDDINMQPVRELVYVGGYDCWETRWIKDFKSIVLTSDFNIALEKLAMP